MDDSRDVLSELGLDPTDEELQDMIDNADANGSGSIEFPEFLNLMIKRVSRFLTRDAQLTVTLLVIKYEYHI